MKVELVLSTVANYYGISVEQMLSPTRVKPVPEARQMVCYIFKDKPKDEVATILNIDRSSVYNHTSRMMDFISLYKDMRDKLQTILTQINHQYDDHKTDTQST